MAIGLCGASGDLRVSIWGGDMLFEGDILLLCKLVSLYAATRGGC